MALAVQQYTGLDRKLVFAERRCLLRPLYSIHCYHARGSVQWWPNIGIDRIMVSTEHEKWRTTDIVTVHRYCILLENTIEWVGYLRIISRQLFVVLTEHWYWHELIYWQNRYRRTLPLREYWYWQNAGVAIVRGTVLSNWQNNSIGEPRTTVSMGSARQIYGSILLQTAWNNSCRDVAVSISDP